jgi:hypothetical protein
VHSLPPKLGCALVFASEAKNENETKISFRLEAKMSFRLEAKMSFRLQAKNGMISLVSHRSETAKN